MESLIFACQLVVGTSLVAELVENLPAMQETWVQSLGWEDPLEKVSLPIPVFWPGEFHELYSPWISLEYWNGNPFPSPEDLPNPGIEPRSSPLQVDSLPAEPPGKPK